MRCFKIVLFIFLGLIACNKTQSVPKQKAAELVSTKTALSNKIISNHDTSTNLTAINRDTSQSSHIISTTDTIHKSFGITNQIDTSHLSPLPLNISEDTLQQSIPKIDKNIEAPPVVTTSISTASSPQFGKLTLIRYLLWCFTGFSLLFLIILSIDLYRRNIYNYSPKNTKHILISLVPCYAASLFFFLLSILFFSLTILPNEYSTLFIILHTGLLVSSVFALMVPSFLDPRQIALFNFPDAVNVASRTAGDLKRDYNRMISSLEGLQNQTQSHLVSMDSIRKTIEENLINRIQFETRIGEEVALRTKFEKHVSLLVEKLCDYVRVLERLNSAQGLSDDYLAAVVQCREYLNKNFMSLNISIIIPQAGDEFDAQIHEAAGEIEVNSIESGKIARVLTWGIRTPDNCERSKVLLARAISTKNIDTLEESCPNA